MFPEVLIGLTVAVVICYYMMKLILKFVDPKDHDFVCAYMIIPMGCIMAMITFVIGYPLSGIM